MKCVLISIICLITVGSTITGCGKTNGLLSSAGFGRASDVSFVILKDGQMYKVSDASTIRQLYDVVNLPDRNWVTMMARNQLMAFVGNDGRVACFAYEAGGNLTATQGSNKFTGILVKVTDNPACRDASHVPIAQMTKIDLHSPKGVATVSPNSGAQWGKVYPPLVALLESWPSDELRGSERCRQKEIDEISRRAYRYIDLDFARPATFKTLIVPNGFVWWPPPETVETRTRYEEVSYDRVRIINTRLGVQAKHERKIGEVRLAFGTKTEDTWVLTKPTRTRSFLGYSPKGRSQFGPDLLDAAVFALAP